MVGGIQIDSDNMIIQNINGTENGHSFVDLGLPSGLLWATCNVGAESPEQAGLYFAWGETTGFTAEQVFSWIRLFRKSEYSACDINENLLPVNDAAHVNMGGNWRMPTKVDFQELIDNCDVAWTEDYNGTGAAGRIFTSKTNGNSIFLPAAGYASNYEIIDKNKTGGLWSSTFSRGYGQWSKI